MKKQIKQYTVFYSFTGVGECLVKAKNKKEAREKFYNNERTPIGEESENNEEIDLIKLKR